MKVGVDLHRGSKFVKLPSSFKNMSSINSDTLLQACRGVWEIVVFGEILEIFDCSVPRFKKLTTPSCDLIQKNCLYTDLDMTLDNECVVVIGLKDIPGGGYSMWRNRDLRICKLVKSLSL